MTGTDTSTQLDNFFDQFYPGSKKKRRTPLDPPPKAQKTESSWDSRPVKKKIGGVEVEMFTIGALASALERPLPTIRMWLDRGYLPQSPYRLRSVEVHGKLVPGRRLYTRPMIESAIRAFAQRGLLDRPRIEWSEHSDLTAEIENAWKPTTND
jgi:hypothetical protein